MDFDYFFDKKVELLKHRIELSTRDLEKAADGKLWTEMRGNEIRYYNGTVHNGQKKRILLNNNPELIAELARKDYLRQEIKMMNENIQLLEKTKELLRNQYQDTSAVGVLEKLKDGRRSAAYENYYLSAVDKLSTPLRHPIDKSRYPGFILDWAASKYNRSSYRTEDLKHRSSYGLFTRTKSELSIVERLYAHMVPPRYEEIIQKNGIIRIPDFIVPSASGKLYYWEHLGMMNNPNYRRLSRRKLEEYEEIGIVPWDNLILTYDYEDGSIDMAEVDAIIRVKLL